MLRRHSSSSMSSSADQSSPPARGFQPPVLVYHENARDIVFRDQLRRAAASSGHEPLVTAPKAPQIVPLDSLELTQRDEFQELDLKDPDLSIAERDVVRSLREQTCVVKTIKNTDWTAFLHRFQSSVSARTHNVVHHHDIPSSEDFPFNSFVTSTSLLPPNGLKMRCFGSVQQYTVGVVFQLPNAYVDASAEDEAAKITHTWAWPAGYSAKTEFNIDSKGRLLHGRQEALVPLSVLRQYNRDYLEKTEYMVGLRKVSGLQQIPYNEVYVRVGGIGRLVENEDVVHHTIRQRSFERGVGLPVALFVRSASYGHLLSLMRTRARLMHSIGDAHFKNIPLLYITPEHGVRVLTENLQRELWKRAANNLMPFQNPTIAYRTTMEHTDEASYQQKVEELFEIDDSIREQLTPEEIGKLAGGFGVSDVSVATVLQDAMLRDKQWKKDHQGKDESHRLQDVVNEGLASAVRSNDFHTSRQLLLLYSLVASSADEDSVSEEATCETRGFNFENSTLDACVDEAKMAKELERITRNEGNALSSQLPPPPPPPPLDTDRLRSATNSDGLLAVLGAAQVLKSMRNDTAKQRVHEAVAAIDEWVGYGEQSLAFRVASWYDQRAAQGDLKIATDNDTKLMAFVSNKAVSNRKKFAQQLRDAVENTDFQDVRFLLALIEILKEMHSPCLRLELLQYVLGLDNRYSVAHVIRSVELAASCLGFAASARNSFTED